MKPHTLLAAALVFAPLSAWAGSLSVENAAVRAPLGQNTTTAGYLVVKNDSDQEIDLVSAASDGAGRVEIHDHIHENGIMKMVAVDRLSIPAQGEVVLKPHGKHLMIFDLKQPLKDGDTLPVTLTFSDGSTLEIKAPVKTRP